MPTWKNGVSETKDPNDIKKIQWDLNAWLNGLTLSSYSIIVSGASNDSDSQSSNIVTAFISGGTAGTQSKVTLRAVRSDTKQQDLTVLLDIKEDYTTS